MKIIPSFFHRKRDPETNRFRRDHFWYKISDDPFVDWVFVLSLSVILAVILVAIGAYVYVDGAAQLAATPPIVPTETSASHFDAKELDRIIGAFDARAAERVLLNRAYSGPTDPSLP